MGIGTWYYKSFVRPSYFSLPDPEDAHEVAKEKLSRHSWIKLFSWYFDVAPERLSVNLGGRVELDGVIGNAAGFDKDAEMILGLSQFFDYVTVGTMLPYSWRGNPTRYVDPKTGSEDPRTRRIIRLEDEEAMVNCLGFNFSGPEGAAANIRDYGGIIPINANIAVRPVEGENQKEAIQQFGGLVRKIAPYVPDKVQMIEANFASPNTKGLAVFFEEGTLEELAKHLTSEYPANRALLFLKMPPHTDEKTRDKNLDVATRWLDAGGDGFTVINTLRTPDERLSMKSGGKSGRVIYPILRQNLSDYRKQFGHRKPIINAAGGIWPENVPEIILDDGADTVQFFTSFIYEGPAIVREAKIELVKGLNRNGYNNLREVENHSYS